MRYNGGRKAREVNAVLPVGFATPIDARRPDGPRPVANAAAALAYRRTEAARPVRPLPAWAEQPPPVTYGRGSRRRPATVPGQRLDIRI